MKVAVTLWVGEIGELIKAALAKQGTPLTGDIIYSHAHNRATRHGNTMMIDVRGAYFKASCPTASGTVDVWHGPLDEMIKTHLIEKGYPAEGEVVYSYKAGSSCLVGNKVLIDIVGNYLSATCESFILK